MNEEELLERAAEERATIVAKYKHGRKEGAIIDPWEDPEIQQYQNIDRYGFIYDKNGGKHFSGDGREVEEKNAAEVKIEMERIKKWLKMLSSWDDVAGTEKLKRRVFKGIPESLRSKAWSKMLNLEFTKKKHRGKYQEMRELAWKWSPDIRQIDLDVNRTYRDHIMFRQRYNIKQQELFNVLGAYSMYNLEIGYCQGMSQIAALLLMYFDEEEAFWALANLVAEPKYNMHGFFIPGFPKLLRFQEHHDKIMKKFLPKLKKHLDKNGVDTGIYTLKWFFQCFLDRIPFRLTLRVWDIYLFVGDRVLSAMAYNLLKLHRRKLNSLGMDDILQFLQVHLERKFEIDDDIAIESLNRCLEELKRNKLDYPGPPPANELPQRPFGHFKEPLPFEQRVGRRRSEFTPEERSARDSVSIRREEAITQANQSDYMDTTGHDSDSDHVEANESSHQSNHVNQVYQISSNIAEEQPDARGWLDANIDETSSLVGDGSRRSLADTSITSTADLSAARSAIESLGSDPATPRGPSPDIPSPPDLPSPDVPSPADVLRIYVPYESPAHPPHNGDLPHLPLDNRIRILVMDHTPEESTPLVEMPSPFHPSPIDLK